MKKNNKKSHTEYIVTSEHGNESIERTVEKIIELFEKELTKNEYVL